MFRGCRDEEVMEVLGFESTWAGSAVLREGPDASQNAVKSFLYGRGIPVPGQLGEHGGWCGWGGFRRVQALQVVPHVGVLGVLDRRGNKEAARLSDGFSGNSAGDSVPGGLQEFTFHAAFEAAGGGRSGEGLGAETAQMVVRHWGGV